MEISKPFFWVFPRFSFLAEDLRELFLVNKLFDPYATLFTGMWLLFSGKMATNEMVGDVRRFQGRFGGWKGLGTGL